jgi:hypothetical protein
MRKPRDLDRPAADVNVLGAFDAQVTAQAVMNAAYSAGA